MTASSAESPGPVEVVGEIRSTPSRGLRRVVGALTLWLLLKSVVRLLGRALGYRRHARLHLEDEGLVLDERRSVVGRNTSTKRSLFPLERLEEVALVQGAPGRSVTVGLTALTVGTYFGAGLFVEGLRAPAGTGALVGLGLLLIAAGALLDFVLDSGWIFSDQAGKSAFLLKSAGNPPVTIRRVDADRAAKLLERVQGALSGEAPSSGAASVSEVAPSSASGPVPAAASPEGLSSGASSEESTAEGSASGRLGSS